VAEVQIHLQLAAMTGRPAKYQKYKSESDRKKARRNQLKCYQQTRVRLGSAFEEWECQRTKCCMGQTGFAQHLLALHEAHCHLYQGDTHR